MPRTLYLYRYHVHIVAGRYQTQHGVSASCAAQLVPRRSNPAPPAPTAWSQDVGPGLPGRGWRAHQHHRVCRPVPERGSEPAREFHRSEEAVMMARYRAAMLQSSILGILGMFGYSPHRRRRFPSMWSRRSPSGSPAAHQAAHQRRAPIRQGPGTSTSVPRSVPAGDHRGGTGIPVQKRSTLQLVHLAQPASSQFLRRRQPAKLPVTRQSIRDPRLPPPARRPCGCAHGPCRSMAAPARCPMRRTAQAQPVGDRAPADIHQGGPCSCSEALGRPPRPPGSSRHRGASSVHRALPVIAVLNACAPRRQKADQMAAAFCRPGRPCYPRSTAAQRDHFSREQKNWTTSRLPSR